MRAEDVVALYRDLGDAGVPIYIDGGWCVDALVGRETRPHDDLDIAVERRFEARLSSFLEARGYAQVERTDSTAWMFVMSDGNNVVDVHVVEYDHEGNHRYGVEYPYGSLAGRGRIANCEVNCVKAEWMFRFKTSYEPKEKDRHDIAELAATFKFSVPPTHRLEES